MKRLTAFQAELPRFEKQGVQVLGISTDDNVVETARWAEAIGVSFPLMSDSDGAVSKKYGMFDEETQSSSKALLLIQGESVLYSRTVSETNIPDDLPI